MPQSGLPQSDLSNTDLIKSSLTQPASAKSPNPRPCWFVYLIRTSKGHLYTGITTDVERRFAQHQQGIGAKYLRSKGPLTLVYAVAIGGRSLASKVEYAIKALPKAKKEAIATQQPTCEQLLRILQKQMTLGD